MLGVRADFGIVMIPTSLLLGFLDKKQATAKTCAIHGKLVGRLVVRIMLTGNAFQKLFGLNRAGRTIGTLETFSIDFQLNRTFVVGFRRGCVGLSRLFVQLTKIATRLGSLFGWGIYVGVMLRS